MIQRIQSLFLLAATLLSGSMVVFPLSEYILKNGDLVKFYAKGLYNNTQNTNLHLNTLIPLVLFIAITLISLITIFFYTKRILQMRLCVYNILLTLAQIGVMFYYYYSIRNGLPVRTSGFTITVIFPFVNIILIFQAFRTIRRDDLLIKSYDRLR